MNPYLFTVVFLMLMGLITSSEVIRFSHNAKEQTFFSNSLSSKSDVQYMAALTRLDDYLSKKEAEDEKPDPNPKSPRKKGEQKERIRKSVPLRFNLDRPPNNSRLNIYLLMHEDLLIKGYPKEFTLYETAAGLMRLLYQDAPFYQTNCEYALLDELLKKTEEVATFTSPDELSSLTMSNETLQEIFYSMLRGRDGFPSLLHYITFDKDLKDRSPDKKINFLFASSELLQTVFANRPDLVEKLEKTRAEFWDKIIDQEEHRLERTIEQCKGRKDWSKAIGDQFKLIIKSAGLEGEEYAKIFDFTLGKYGNVLLVYDPVTGITHREKIYKISKASRQN